jgi:ligand-binding sensor domain-containing protein
MFKVLLTEILFCFSIVAYTQQGNLYFRQLTTSDGLSQSWVRCIHQDKLGYMWFGTDDGLNRFDGVDFKIYRTVPKQEYSLDNVSINYIAQKSENELWICTDQGINVYHQELDIFTSFPYLTQLGVYYVYNDSKGRVWFGTSMGLHCFSPKDNSVSSYFYDKDDPSSISSNNIRVIMQDSKDNLWIGTDRGLNLYRPETGSFIRYVHSNDPNSLLSDDVHAIVEDAWNRIWLGTSQGGLVLFLMHLKDQLMVFLKP